MRLTFSSLFILATAAFVTADGAFLDLNPPLDTLTPNSVTPSTGAVRRVVGRMTNGKRLAMNLPPLKPKALRRGTPAASAARSNTSMSPPVPHECNILVKKVADGSTLGYLSPRWNSFGEYGAVQADQAGALKVTFNASPDAASDELDFIAANGPNSLYPYFGAGFASSNDNLGPGSRNYAYIAGTTQTPSGPPQAGDNAFSAATSIPEDVESAIWKYNPMTQDISAQWINTDGSLPTTYLVYTQQVLSITGDFSTFQNSFGPSQSLTLTCVPPVAS